MRRLVAALLLLNLALLTWLLLGGSSDQKEREPTRVQQQLNPDRVRVLPPEDTASDGAPFHVAQKPQDGASPNAGDAPLAPSPASAVAAGVGASTAAGGLGPVTGAVTALNAVCLEAGPFDAQSLPAAEAALAALPRGSWRRQALEPAPAYLVYMGRFSDQKTAQRRLQDLRQRGVEAELARDLPALEPGLVFSRHTEEAQAEAALAELQASRGPHQARVVPTSEAAAVLLRVEHPTDEVRSQIAAMEPTPAMRGGFRGCRKTKS
ncbi:hypothetical protein [uncultured Azohydromonas sp.]|jgi:hypothetical protein|uniref:hypothetical protein n=1 Tax=uncultured Azohydromonas sp. TaxID=487342 RepID=UPI002635DD8E|nr:hypothetical protein [uncultured Azohydromonas sp.]